jgi:hypothetical protein
MGVARRIDGALRNGGISLRAYSRKLDGALGELNKADNIGDTMK